MNALSQLLDGCAFQDLGHGALRIGPHRMSGAPALAVADVIAGEAEIEVNRAFDGFHHLQDGDGLGCRRELKPTSISAVGDNQTRARQALQDLR